MSAEASFQSLFRHPSIQSFNPYSKAVFSDLAACHTAAKGYHLSRCDRQECGNLSHSYHCCGNRHCPNCGSMKRDAWIADRMDELLPTAYYHMVFTLPHELNPVIMGNRSKLFDLLFQAASQTLLKHARMPEYLGAEPGITMVLHTWGQDLSFHPHSLSRLSGYTVSSVQEVLTATGGKRPNAKTIDSSSLRKAWPKCTRPYSWIFWKRTLLSSGTQTKTLSSKP
jgi:hypothetical protein